MRRLEKGLALVLERQHGGESDSLALVLLENGQLLRLRMHGLRTSKNRNQRMAEAGTLLDIIYYPHTGGPASLKEGCVLESYDDVKHGYRNLEWLAFVLEITGFAAQQDCGPELFQLLRGMLTTMQKIVQAQQKIFNEASDLLLFNFFAVRILNLLGLLGETAYCAACGEELRKKARWIKPEVYFYCDACSLDANETEFWMARLLGYAATHRYGRVADAFQSDLNQFALNPDSTMLNPNLVVQTLSTNLLQSLQHTYGKAFGSTPDVLIPGE